MARLGALAHGIGTSEVEHVLATQTLRARKMKNMAVDLPRCRAGAGGDGQGYGPAPDRKDRYGGRHMVMRHGVSRRSDSVAGAWRAG